MSIQITSTMIKRLLSKIPRPAALEPGLIEVLRYFSAIELIITSAALMVSIYISTTINNLSMTVVPLDMLLGILRGSWMLLYLSPCNQWLRHKLGHAYLPLAIWVTVIELMARQRLWYILTIGLEPTLHFNIYPVMVDNVSGIVPMLAMIEWQVAPALAVLLILMSWQYDFKRVLVLCTLTGAVDIFFPVPYSKLAMVSVTSNFAVPMTTIGVLMRSATFLTAGYIITELMKVQRKQRKELTEANVKLASYAAMIESLAISRERNRLARELHDTLAHTLSASSVQLEAVNSLWDTDSKKAHAILQQSLSATRAGLTETRRALAALRASPLEDLGLLLALRELAATTEARCGCKIELDLPEQVAELPVEIEQAVYRVAQETFENIARHAQARQVALRFRCVDGSIQLEINDDGVGFMPQGVDQGRSFGLRGMMERVRALGGLLDIHSQPGKGTNIRLQLKVA